MTDDLYVPSCQAQVDAAAMTMVMDLWTRLGGDSQECRAYIARNDIGTAWGELLGLVDVRSVCAKPTDGGDSPSDLCVLRGSHMVCYGAADVGYVERLPAPPARRGTR